MDKQNFRGNVIYCQLLAAKDGAKYTYISTVYILISYRPCFNILVTHVQNNVYW